MKKIYDWIMSLFCPKKYTQKKVLEKIKITKKITKVKKCYPACKKQAKSKKKCQK